MKPAIHRHVTVYESSKGPPKVGIIIEVTDRVLTCVAVDGQCKSVPAMCVRVLSSYTPKNDKNLWLPHEQGQRTIDGEYWEWPQKA